MTVLYFLFYLFIIIVISKKMQDRNSIE